MKSVDCGPDMAPGSTLSDQQLLSATEIIYQQVEEG